MHCKQAAKQCVYFILHTNILTFQAWSLCLLHNDIILSGISSYTTPAQSHLQSSNNIKDTPH